MLAVTRETKKVSHSSALRLNRERLRELQVELEPHFLAQVLLAPQCEVVALSTGHQLSIRAISIRLGLNQCSEYSSKLAGYLPVSDSLKKIGKARQ